MSGERGFHTEKFTEYDPGIFPVYGHHFKDPQEGEYTSAFQCWGWATTSAKLNGDTSLGQVCHFLLIHQLD